MRQLKYASLSILMELALQRGQNEWACAGNSGPSVLITAEDAKPGIQRADDVFMGKKPAYK